MGECRTMYPLTLADVIAHADQAADSENAVQLSLFIQALIRFQQMDFQDKLSYYQVAGIHGYPATSWYAESGACLCEDSDP